MKPLPESITTALALLACPFCGSNDVENGHTVPWWVQCHDCGVEGPTADTEGESAKRWNEAPRPPDSRAALAEVDRLTARVAEVEQARAGDVAGIVAYLRSDALIRRWNDSVGGSRMVDVAADAINRGDWRDAPLPPDPRDARIAELESEVAGLRAAADTAPVMRKPRKPVPLAVGQVRLDPDPRRTGEARRVTVTSLDAPSVYRCRHDGPASAEVVRCGRKSRIAVATLERWSIVPADTVTGGGST